MDKEELAAYIGLQIKHLRSQRQWTQTQLGQKIGVGKASISNYEKGFRTPKKDQLYRLAQTFSISVEAFFPATSKASIFSLSQNKLQKIYQQLETGRQQAVLAFAQEQLEQQGSLQLIEYHVYERLSAGTGYGYSQDLDYDVVFSDQDIAHDLASWVFGDSMEPHFSNGSVALIKDTGWDYDGAIYAVDWNDQSWIKKVYKEEDGLRLVSLNDKYPDKFAPFADNPRIIGKVVGNFTPIEP